MLDVLGNLERTHTCGELRETHVGQQVVLMGWVAKKRDFGVLTFIDLRDREGVTQVVLSEEDKGEAHAKAKGLRGEFVIAVKGEVVEREGTHNAKLATGGIEVHASEILILNDAKVPPFLLQTVVENVNWSVGVIQVLVRSGEWVEGNKLRSRPHHELTDGGVERDLFATRDSRQ